VTRTLVIFVKEPLPGRVKTRLGRDMGMVASARWFRHQALRLARSMAGDARWRTVLAVAPDRAGLESRVWPAHAPRWAQGRGDLGVRMGRVFRTFPPGPVVIVGGDIPDITPALIERAFRALGDHDAVFGPAEDGGYWLVGLKRRRATPPGFMRGVRWSGAHTLSDTLATLPADWRTGTIRTLPDIDTLDDLRAYRAARRRTSPLARLAPLV